MISATVLFLLFDGTWHNENGSVDLSKQQTSPVGISSSCPSSKLPFLKLSAFSFSSFSLNSTSFILKSSAPMQNDRWFAYRIVPAQHRKLEKRRVDKMRARACSLALVVGVFKKRNPYWKADPPTKIDTRIVFLNVWTAVPKESKISWKWIPPSSVFYVSAKRNMYEIMN